MLINFILMNTLHTTPNLTKNGTKLYASNKQIAQLIGLFLWCTASFFTNLHAQDKATIANSYYLNGINQFDEGNYQEAITNFEKAANTIETSTPDMHYYLIKSYMALNKPIEVRDRLLGEYFNEYPHEVSNPMYTELTMLIATIDDMVKVWWQKELSEYNSALSREIKYEIQRMYTPQWAEDIISGKVKERLSFLKNHYDSIRQKTLSLKERYNDFQYDNYVEKYDGWNIFKAMETFLAVKQGVQSFPFSGNDLYLNALNKFGINHNPLHFKYGANGEYSFENYITHTNKVDFTRVFYHGEEDNGASAISSTDHVDLDDNMFHLFNMNVVFYDYIQGKAGEWALTDYNKFYRNSSTIRLILEDDTQDIEAVLEIEYERLWDTKVSVWDGSLNIKDDSRELNAFLMGEKVISTKTTQQRQLYICLLSDRILIMDAEYEWAYDLKLEKKYSKAYFEIETQAHCKNTKLFDKIIPLDVSVESIDLNPIMQEIRECSAFLWDMTTRSN